MLRIRSGCEPRSLRTTAVKTGINCSTTKLTSRFSGLTNKQISRDAWKCESFKNFYCIMAISVNIGQNLQPSHRQSLWWCRKMSEQFSRGTRTPDKHTKHILRQDKARVVPECFEMKMRRVSRKGKKSSKGIHLRCFLGTLLIIL